MAARNAEIVYEPFFMKEMKGKAVIKTFIKGNGRAQRGNFLKS